MLELSTHSEMFRQWKLNPAFVFGSGAFGRLLGLDEAIGVELCD
jgi:hypothetical protein